MPAITKPEGITWTEVLRRTLKEASKDDVLRRSAQLSYYFFLALSNAHLHHLRHEFVRACRFDAAVTVGLSRGGFACLCIGIDTENVDRSDPRGWGRRLEIVCRNYFSVWSASAGMSAMMDTLNSEYEVSESRSFLRRSATAIGLLSHARY